MPSRVFFHKQKFSMSIIHQIRNSTKYIVSKDHKQVMSYMKEIYQAANIEQAQQALKTMEINWKEKYPYMIRSWKNNWPLLSTFYRYPKDIRRVMYTTNIIESFHSQLRKITKTKRIFSSDQSLLKLIYLVYQNKKEGWQSSINAWKLTYSQMMIIFEDRMSQP